MAKRTEILHAIERLLVVYSKPRHVASLSDLAGEWEKVLYTLTPDALDYAVTAYLESAADYFPKPGQLVQFARAMPRRGFAPGATTTDYLAWEQDWGRREVPTDTGVTTTGFTACPVCGAVPEWSPRLRVRHLAQRHREAGVVLIGHSDEVEQFYVKVPQWQRPAPLVRDTPLRGVGVEPAA